MLSGVAESDVHLCVADVIKSDGQTITLISNNPTTHVTTDSPRRTHKHTLTESRLLANQPVIPSSKLSSRRRTPGSPETPQIVRVQLRLDRSCAPRYLQQGKYNATKKHHTQKVPLRNTPIPGPRLTQPSSQLKPKPNM